MRNRVASFLLSTRLLACGMQQVAPTTLAFAAPTRALSREEVRAVDERAIAMGLPGVVLMENAALGLTDVVCEELEKRGAGPGSVVGIVACAPDTRRTLAAC